MTSRSSTSWRALERAYLECVLGYLRPERYPTIAAEAIVAGVESPSLGELAGLSRSTDPSEIALLVETVGTELGMVPESRTLGLVRRFRLWACAVGTDIDAVEFLRRSRLGEVNDTNSPAFDWFSPLIGLNIEWAERYRSRSEVEGDVLELSKLWCKELREEG